jgi:hypothetical protein
VNVYAISSRGKESSVNNQKAKKVDKIRVMFHLQENTLANKEIKTVFLRIIEPTGTTISDYNLGSGTFDFNTVGATSLRLDQSSLIADSIAITAANWLANPLVPTTLGTLTGKASLSLTSGQDIVAHANLATQGALALSAPGRIDLGAINAFGAIRVTAGSSSPSTSIHSTGHRSRATVNSSARSTVESSLPSGSQPRSRRMAGATGPASAASGSALTMGSGRR